MFEDEIIKSMALITNELDIKSSKGKKYATYAARITIDGTGYTTNISSDAELFGGKNYFHRKWQNKTRTFGTN